MTRDLLALSDGLAEGTMDTARLRYILTFPIEASRQSSCGSLTLSR